MCSSRVESLESWSGSMVTSPFEPFLSNAGFVVLDGGLATELEAQVIWILSVLQPLM